MSAAIGRMRRLLSTLAIVVVLSALLTACEEQPQPDSCAVGGGEAPLLALAAAAQMDPCDPPDCEDCGGVWGDPHIVTFDGVRFDLMSVGEFVGVETGDFVVQFRTAPYAGSRTVSITTAVAIRVGDQRVQITRNQAELTELIVTVDGAEQTSGAVRVGDVVIGSRQPGEVTVGLPDGSFVQVGGTASPLDVYVSLADGVEGRGMFGTRNGSPDDDVALPDGTPIDLSRMSSADAFAAIYDRATGLAEHWRVEAEESAFDYADGESTETFTDRTFPDRQPTLDDIPEEDVQSARDACVAAGVTTDAVLDACILDVALTGDPALAHDAARSEQRGAPSTQPQVAVAQADWATVLGGLAVPPAAVVEGSEAVYVSGDDAANGTGVLVSLAADSGDENWRLDDIIAGCGVAAAADGRLVAVAGESSSHANGGQFTVLVIDATTGEILDALPWEQGVHASYCRPLLSVRSAVLISDELGRLGVWDVESTPQLLWERDGLRTAGIVAVDDTLAALVRSADGHDVVVFDPATGSELSRAAVRGTTAPDGALIAAGDTVIVALRENASDAGRHGTVSAVTVATGAAQVQWEYAVEDADGFAVGPAHLASDGARVVGLAGQQMFSIDLATGESQWVVQPAGFRNTSSPPAIHDDVLYDGVFGGAFLTATEAATGELGTEWSAEDLVGSPAGSFHYGPVVGTRLIVLGDLDGETVVVAVTVP